MSAILDGLGAAAGILGKVIATGAVEGARIGYGLGKVTGNVATETVKGAAKGAVIAGKVITGGD